MIQEKSGLSVFLMRFIEEMLKHTHPSSVFVYRSTLADFGGEAEGEDRDAARDSFLISSTVCVFATISLEIPTSYAQECPGW
jgi:hypothetical protein